MLLQFRQQLLSMWCSRTLHEACGVILGGLISSALL
jgi:hypothetical protein